MVTKTEATNENEFHYGECTRQVGPRGGVTERIEHWRANGAIKTWKRNPNRFQLPIKFGMRSYSYLTNDNAHLFHTSAACPLNREA